MIVFVYAVLVFLVLRFTVTLFNFLSNPKLGYYGKHFTDKVSIIILSGPESDPQELLSAIQKQDYDNIEVLIQQPAETEAQLAEKATGRYLLFLKANTTIHHGLINNLIYRTKVFNLTVLSLVPTYTLRGFMEKCSYPLNEFLLLNLIPLRLIRLSNSPAFTAMNDDCLFFDAAIYRQHSWYEKGKKDLTATEVTGLIKQQQLKAELLLGNKQLRAKVILKNSGWFDSPMLPFFGNDTLIALVYLVLVIVGPVVIVLNFSPALIALPLGLIFLSRVMISFMTSQDPLLNVFLHPLQMLVLLVRLLREVWNKTFTSVKHK